jgi:hypothetical protein
MSEEYGVQIKVDPGSSIPTVKEFGAAPRSTEHKTRGMEHAAHGASEALQELSGSASGLVKALASGAAIGAAVEALPSISETIEGISESAHELHERMLQTSGSYIELTNAAQKFTPAGQDGRQRSSTNSRRLATRSMQARVDYRDVRQRSGQRRRT